MCTSEDVNFIEAYLSHNSILKAGMASPVLPLYTFRVPPPMPQILHYSARIEPCIVVLQGISLAPILAITTMVL